MEIKDSRRLQVKIGALLPLLLTVAATTAVGPTARAEGPRADFNIPAGDARSTLLQFYVQSGVQVLYLAEAVQNISTRAVSGSLEASEALARMLEGSGLRFEFESATSAVVRTNAPPPASFGAGDAGDPAFVEQTAVPQTTAFTPPGIYGSGPQGLGEVTVSVTGTHIRGVLDVMSPLEVVTKEELKRAAYGTVQDAMQTLPLNFGAAQSEDFGGTGNFNRGSALNLRGLGTGATLVLVNGRRQPQAGIQADFVDVSNIPWSAIERIEVLPDGTSALYGSDAIAGVVNIILRESLDGSESRIRAGTAPDGAGEVLAGQLFGKTWNDGKWLLAYQYSQRSALAASDRSYTADTDKTSFGGGNYSSFRSGPANILDPRTLAPVFAIPRGQDGAALTAGDLLAGEINLQNRFATRQLLPDKKIHSAYTTVSQRIGEHVELFGEARFSGRELHWQGQPEERILMVPASNPFFVDPFGGSPFVLVAYSFLDDLGPVTGTGHAQSYNGASGVRMEFGKDWQATLSGSYGRESMRWTAYNQVELSGAGLNQALNDPDPSTAFNPFGDGSHTSAATLESIRGLQRSTAMSEISAVNMLADGSLLQMPSGTAKVALGAEWREENLDRTLIGRNLLYIPQSYGRRIAAAFTELSVPLVGKALEPRATPKLDLSLAARYENYSDFGDTYNSKIGLRWAPMESLKLRASWGTAFKAPKLIDLYDVSQNLAGITVLTDPESDTRQSLVLVRQGSNPDLKEETATTWTAGVDLAPVSLPGFTVSITGYSIAYNDQVAQPGGASPFDILSEGDRWQEVIVRNPSRPMVDAICNSPEFVGPVSQCTAVLPAAIVDFRLRNLATTRVKGLDVKLEHTFSTVAGHFNVDLLGGYIVSFEQAFTAGSPATDILDTAQNPLRLRLRGTLEWSRHGPDAAGLRGSLTAIHAGSYSNPNSQQLRAVHPWTTLDLGVGYRSPANDQWWGDMELSLNAANVLGKDPPFVDQEWGYDYINADPYGRVVSLYLTKNWGGQ